MNKLHPTKDPVRAALAETSKNDTEKLSSTKVNRTPENGPNMTQKVCRINIFIGTQPLTPASCDM